jgi:hypothetical protein
VPEVGAFSSSSSVGASAGAVVVEDVVCSGAGAPPHPNHETTVTSASGIDRFMI